MRRHRSDSIETDALNSPVYQELFDRLGMNRTLFANVLAKHDVDPDLLASLLTVVLDKYRSLDVWGSKVALQRDVESIIDDFCSRMDG